MATKAALLSEVTTNFPDNTSGLITPAITRTTHNDEINSWQQAPGVNPQIGTTYTVLTGDYGQLITFNNASPVAVSLPTPATAGFNPFNTFFKNIGAGTATLTPVSPATIDGAASLALGSGQSAYVISDGTNYRTAIIGGGPQLLSVNTTPVSGGVSGNFFYNNAGVFAERTPTQATAALNTFTSALQGLAPASGGGTANFLRADGAWALPPGGGGATLVVATTSVTSGVSGRVLFDNTGILGEYPISGTGNVAMTTSPTFVTPALGTPTSGVLTNCSGYPVFTPTVSGAVPASGGGTTNFLRADGTWVALSGAVSSVANSDGSLTVSPSTGAVIASLNPGHSNTWTAGQLFTAFNAGTISSGTFTPAASNANYQFYTNNGAHTIAAPAADSAIDILVTNGASAGAITFSGFTVGANTGDGTDTVNTHKFLISIRRINAIAMYNIQALQ